VFGHDVEAAAEVLEDGSGSKGPAACCRAASVAACFLAIASPRVVARSVMKGVFPCGVIGSAVVEDRDGREPPRDQAPGELVTAGVARWLDRREVAVARPRAMAAVPARHQVLLT
jgi:hypothetical protein